MDTFQANAKKPEILLRLYTTTAFISIAVILLLTGLGIHGIYSRHIINNAEEDAVKISKALLEEEKDFLISALPVGRPRLEVEESGPALFDRHIRKFLQPFDIVKIKIYNAESRVIYSTDPAIIGKVDSGNKSLNRALLGDNASKLEKKDKVVDMAGERRFDVDVVETYIPVRDAAGKVMGSFEIYMDVTKYRAEIRRVVAMSVAVLAMILFLVFALSFLLIRRGTLQLKEAQEELVHSEKLAMLGMIAGNMGNELRNPLGVMNNAVFFLQTVMPDADKKVREYLDIIRNEIENLQRIISELLDFFQNKPLRAKAMPIHELIRQSCARCAIPENIRFQPDLPETLPKVLGDPLQMGQVFRNLIANAVQAMPNGGALRVSARRVLSSEFGVLSSHLKAETLDPKSDADVALTSELKFFDSNSKLKTQNSELDGDFVEITVEDTGTGIAPEHMTKLFQPLFTTKSRGIGLGLAISQKLTEANGGRLAVTSEFGKGTIFTVILPAGEGGTWTEN